MFPFEAGLRAVGIDWALNKDRPEGPAMQINLLATGALRKVVSSH